MMTHAPQLALDRSHVEIQSFNHKHWLVSMLLSLVVFGGWGAAWMLILGWGLKLAVVILAGFVFLSFIPAPKARLHAPDVRGSEYNWEQRPIPSRSIRIR